MVLVMVEILAVEQPTVVDIEKATRTIIAELKNRNLLERVKIAYFNPEEDEI